MPLLSPILFLDREKTPTKFVLKPTDPIHKVAIDWVRQSPDLDESFLTANKQVLGHQKFQWPSPHDLAGGDYPNGSGHKEFIDRFSAILDYLKEQEGSPAEGKGDDKKTKAQPAKSAPATKKKVAAKSVAGAVF